MFLIRYLREICFLGLVIIVLAAVTGCARSPKTVSYPDLLKLEQSGDTPMGPQFVQEGKASWYGPRFHGRKTANGERYNQHELTCAHRKLPFGAKLKVTNLANDKEVIVRVNDRGPYVRPRIIDLSRAAAEAIDMIYDGVETVRLEWVE